MSSKQTQAGQLIPFSGAHNFRDIGGYATSDGRCVATKLVYRSGTLARLTETDLARIAELGLRVVCDFRANAERASRPSRLPADAGIEIWVRDHEASAGDLMAAMSGPAATKENSRQLMIEIYRGLAYEQAESCRELFLRIADGHLPLLFHCSAGKDRTGAAAALLLHVLGVPRPVIIEDYLLTELFFDDLLAVALHDLGSNALHGTTQEVWEPLMRADAAYIDALFETLESRHAGVEGYLREVLRLEDGMLDRIRARLLI
jgi:protein-tyrosine phosphatase